MRPDVQPDPSTPRRGGPVHVVRRARHSRTPRVQGPSPWAAFHHDNRPHLSGGDWSPLTNFLTRRAAVGNRISSLSLRRYPHMGEDVVESIRRAVEVFEDALHAQCGSLNTGKLIHTIQYLALKFRVSAFQTSVICGVIARISEVVVLNRRDRAMVAKMISLEDHCRSLLVPTRLSDQAALSFQRSTPVDSLAERTRARYTSEARLLRSGAYTASISACWRPQTFVH
jgi:hypothetical protein